jgi:hypothetical protein
MMLSTFAARMRALWCVSFVLFAGSAQAITVRVGPINDPACQTSSISAALTMLPATTDAHRVLVSTALTYPVAGSVGSLNVTIEGGYASCSAALPVAGARSRIGPQAGGAVRLFRTDTTQGLRGVTLRHLEFNGPAPQGAIAASGAIDLVLDDVLVSNAGSSAIDGGGVLVQDEAFLFLRGGTEISGNTASNGGGVHCMQGRVFIEDSEVLISGNRAAFGGGMGLQECIFEWTPDSNSTQGGIKGNAVSGGGGGIFTTNSEIRGEGDFPRPVQANRAAFFGGGIALFTNSELALPSIEIRSNAAGDATSPSGQGHCGGLYAESSDVSLSRFRIEGNTAWRDAGGLCLDSGATFVVSTPVVACPFGECRSLSFNRAGLGGGTGNGGAMRVRASSTVELHSTRVTDNFAPSFAGGAFEDGDPFATSTSAEFINSLFVRNQSLASGLFGLSNSSLFVSWSTVAENRNGAAMIVAAGTSPLFLSSSILYGEAATTVLSAPPGTGVTTRCLIARERATLQAFGGDATVTDPGFAAPAFDDFRISPNEGAIDFCAPDPNFTPPLDLSGNARPVDLPIGNVAGPYDVGALETQNDAMFSDGFE